MNRSRLRIAAVVVPALIVGALLGDWVGGQLFSAPGSTADGPAGAGLDRLFEATAPPPSTSVVLSTPTPPPSPGTQLSPVPGQPPPGSPGNPGAANPPPPQPPPTGGTTTTAPPPPPDWQPRLDTSIQVNGGGQQLGRVQGWFQMHSDRKHFRYSFTFCRQSSYMLPNLAVAVNGQYVGQTWQSTPITTIYPSYSGGPLAQPCYGPTETVSNEHSYPSIQNVYFKLSGSTFLNGNEHTVFTQDRTYYNSN